MRLMLACELFMFVTAPLVESPNGETQPVSGTNNEAERTLHVAVRAAVRTNGFLQRHRPTPQQRLPQFLCQHVPAEGAGLVEGFDVHLEQAVLEDLPQQKFTPPLRDLPAPPRQAALISSPVHP